MKEHIADLLADGFVFPESPRWRDGRLWFSDMWDFKVHRMSPGKSAEVVCEVPGRPSGLGFLPDGTPLVVSMKDRTLLAIESGEPRLYARLSDVAAADLNDILVDDSGRAYVGNFGFDLFGGATPANGSVALVSADGSVRVAADDLVFPNGAVLLDGGRTYVVAETFANRLTAFDRSPAGTLSGRRIYAHLGERTPDGLCADQEDGIWVSSFATGEFIRVVPGGDITDRLLCPDKRAVACALGGRDGRTLFCATFAGELEDIAKRKRAGAIETAHVTVPGA